MSSVVKKVYVYINVISDSSLFTSGGSTHEMVTTSASSGATNELTVSPGQSAGAPLAAPFATDLIDLGPDDLQFNAGSHLVHRPRPTPKKAQSCKCNKLYTRLYCMVTHHSCNMAVQSFY